MLSSSFSMFALSNTGILYPRSLCPVVREQVSCQPLLSRIVRLPGDTAVLVGGVSVNHRHLEKKQSLLE